MAGLTGAAFQRVSDAIVYIMRRHGYDLVAYIDNYIGVAPANSAKSQFSFLSDLLTKLGLPMNPDKRVPPCKALTCLGIPIGINASSLSIDHSKLQSIYDECLQVSGKKYLSKKKYQSLLGKLIYLHKCVVPARVFVNRILELFRKTLTRRRYTLLRNFSVISLGFKLFFHNSMVPLSSTNPRWVGEPLSTLMPHSLV